MDKKRIFAGAIDYIISYTIEFVFLYIFIAKPKDESAFGHPFVLILYILYNLGIFSYAVMCSTAYLLLRDIIGKKSIGKRLFKLKIVNKKDGNEAHFGKRLLRNITWLLGAAEIFVLLAFKERLGDKIAGTKVVGDEYNFSLPVT